MPATIIEIYDSQGRLVSTTEGTGGGGTGTVQGPDTSTDEAIAVFDGTDGTTIKNSNVTVSSGGILSAVGAFFSGLFGNKAVVTDADKGLTSSATTSTEIGYVAGVTSSIQTQLNTKQAVVAGVDDTELGYVNGVTSSIQAQLNAKLDKTIADFMGAGVNYVAPASRSTASGWAASGAGVTVTTDTVSAYLPRQSTNPSSIKVARVSGSSDYAYYRFRLDNVDDTNSGPGAIPLVIQCAYMGGASNASNDWRFQLWSNAASDYSGVYTQQTVLDGSYGAFTATFNNRNWLGYIKDMSSTTDVYLELRIKLNASTASTEIHVSDVFAGYMYGASQAPGQLMGTVTNDTPISGGVGELLINSRANGSATSMTSATIHNIASITLTPGQWEVSAGASYKPDTTTSITSIEAGIDTTTASFGASDGMAYSGPTVMAIKASQYMPATVPGATTSYLSLAIPPVIVRVASNTTLYLNVRGGFTISTLAGFGHIKAVRPR